MILSPYTLDADHMFWGLWQGAWPPRGEVLWEQGFDVVVFCAQEYQPGKAEYLGVEVICAGYDDNVYHGLTPKEEALVFKTAKTVASRVDEGKRVLVTCRAGLNRSGLVTAVAMHMLTGVSGAACREWVQSRRNMALFNSKFVERLEKIPGRGHEDLVRLARMR